MLSANFRERAEFLVIPLAKTMARLRISPNALTLLGFLSSLVAAYSFAASNLQAALYFLLISGFFDIMDGAVARVSSSVTRFGGFLDSVLDRYSDAVILLGIALYFADYYLLILLVLTGCLLVSYTRARAEKELQKCDVGIAERGERMLILMFATFLDAFGFASDAIFYSLILLAAITHFTVLQRVSYTYLALR